MKSKIIDTNVIVRYLVESPATIAAKFKGVFTFFPRIEKGEIVVELTELVLFETFFVLTRIYKVPQNEAAEKLSGIVSFKGVQISDKALIGACLKILQDKKIDLVDAYLLALAKKKGIHDVYSFDSDLSRYGLKLIEIK
ncbi:MAG: PIN domain-containing protein [Proteobacteria bacterium]|nr:PIN domain-containing protein [Pseudomonadota bacterium]